MFRSRFRNLREVAVGGLICAVSVSVALAGPLVGDFNPDGVLDCADLELLTMMIASGGFNIVFDLNLDGAVNLLDRDLWLAIAGAENLPSGNAYLVGDADLDGTVDGLDFIVWNGDKFTANSSWCHGDFNADGVVDGLDLIAWNSNAFQEAK